MNDWQTLTANIVACRTCSRLVAWREQVAREKRRAYRDQEYWGRPVPGFGDPVARLLIVGLAPGAHGSNRTGRMFTGDSSGDTLYAALYRTGFASQPIARGRDDGLRLTDVFITAVGRCVPPGNRPTAEELTACRPFLAREWALMSQVRVILALGQMAFDGCQRLVRDEGFDLPRLKFRHGLHYSIGSYSSAPSSQGREETEPSRAFRHLIASYHPSRQNTQTGRLTPDMLDEIFALARSLLAAG